MSYPGELRSGDSDAEAFGAQREPDGGPLHPGTVLRRFLEASGISETAFAEHTRIKLDELSRILHGRRRLSTSRARRIAAATGLSAKTWLALEAARELWEEERQEKLQIDVMPSPLRPRQPPPGKAPPAKPLDGRASE